MRSALAGRAWCPRRDRLFDFPAEDLATAGRVLAILTARANAELTAR